ncbi:hypothetical protein [Pseudoalteromonas galatheae]|uniref:hypothetical protein n=1 Tax=Pseudoalteromonas galatheae TaxID=579562 RepID=UPI0030CA8EE2
MTAEQFRRLRMIYRVTHHPVVSFGMSVLVLPYLLSVLLRIETDVSQSIATLLALLAIVYMVHTMINETTRKAQRLSFALFVSVVVTCILGMFVISGQ